MSKKDDSILFGAERAGITWLFSFYNRRLFDRAQAGAKRLGMNLAELMCRLHPFTGAPRLQEARKFTDEDRESSTLKIKLTECDLFTWRCLVRQASICGFETVEEYILDIALTQLVGNEDESILDPRTGEALFTGLEIGDYEGCNVDKDAPQPPPPNYTRIPIPTGTIVEQCV